MYTACMNTVEQVITKIPAAKLANELGILRSAVYGWKERNQIPAKRVKAVSKLTGIPAAELRPDIFGD